MMISRSRSDRPFSAPKIMPFWLAVVAVVSGLGSNVGTMSLYWKKQNRKKKNKGNTAIVKQASVLLSMKTHYATKYLNIQYENTNQQTVKSINKVYLDFFVFIPGESFLEYITF